MMAIHNVSPVKNSHNSFDDITPIKPYLDDISKEDKIISPNSPSHHEQIEIISFDSAEMME
jgi:hypothetical protein